MRANSWQDVSDLSARAGVVLDEWQDLILQAAMGERADATWAAKRVGVCIPRQNGKSQLLVARALAGALLFGERKIVVSAHQQDTSRETFGKLVELLEDDENDWLRSRLDPRFGRDGVMNALNREAVRFKVGGETALIQFKARTASGGRGFSADCLLLDEAQRLKRPAWVSINSTMSARDNPQVWLLGTPPTRDDYDGGMGEVFESVRTAALEGESTALAWAEWGADPDSAEYAAAMRRPPVWTPEVEAACWAANPAWNTRINREVVQGEHESYTAEEFALDRLGVWLSDVGGGTRAISAELWHALEGAPPEGGYPTYAVAFSKDGMRMSLAGAFRTADDERTHVELIDDPYVGAVDGGLAPLADWFCERVGAGPRYRRAAKIVLAGGAGAGVLRQYLIDRGVPERRVQVCTTPQYVQACEMFRKAAEDRTVTHKPDGQGPLDASIAVCDRDSRGGWKATVEGGDETPTEAVSLALYGARTARPPRAQNEKRRAVIL